MPEEVSFDKLIITVIQIRSERIATGDVPLEWSLHLQGNIASTGDPWAVVARTRSLAVPAGQQAVINNWIHDQILALAASLDITDIEILPE